MSVFDKKNQKKFQESAATRSSSDFEYLRAGHYFMRVDCVKEGVTTVDETDFVAVEMTCVKVLDDDAGQGHKVGDSVNWLRKAIKIKKAGLTYFYKDLMNLFSALLNEDRQAFEDGEVTLAECQELCEDEDTPGGPLNGFVIEVNARNRPGGEDEDGKQKMYLANNPFKRRLLIDEVEEELDEKAISRFFPDDLLDSLREMEENLESE